MQDLTLRFIGGALGSGIGATHVLASRLDARWNISQSYFSRNLDKNQATHQKYNIPLVEQFADINDFLKKTIRHTDLYVVVTPPEDHFNIISDICLLNGNFLCEKPLLCKYDQVDQVRHTLHKHQGLHLAVHNFSGYTMVREMRHLIQENFIGKILHFDCEFLVDSFIQNPQGVSLPQWKKIDGNIPALLLDLGPHLHHLSSFLITSNITTVQSRLKSLSNSVGIIDYAEISGDYDCGAVYTMRMSRIHAGHKANINVGIYGSHGSMVWRHDRADELAIYKKNQGHLTLTRENLRTCADKWGRGKIGNPTGHLESFANLYSDISEMISNKIDSPYILPIESALQGIEFLSKAGNNKPVNIDII